jgi:hypothetical protein
LRTVMTHRLLSLTEEAHTHICKFRAIVDSDSQACGINTQPHVEPHVLQFPMFVKHNLLVRVEEHMFAVACKRTAALVDEVGKGGGSDSIDRFCFVAFKQWRPSGLTAGTSLHAG